MPNKPNAPEVHLFTNLNLDIACGLSVYDLPDDCPPCTFLSEDCTCIKCKVAISLGKNPKKLLQAIIGGEE